MSEKKDTSYYCILWIIIIIGSLCSITHCWFGYSSMWFAHSNMAMGSDDAYITFRYAYNLYHGLGLVFNPGERIEGYSNTLFLLLMTPGNYFGKDNIYGYCIALLTVFFAASIFVFSRFVYVQIGKRESIVAAFLLAFNPWLWVAAATGLETLVTLFITICAMVITTSCDKKSCCKNNFFLIGIVFLSVLNRIDGFILPALMAFNFLIKRNYKYFFIVIAALFFIITVYTVFRMQYFGEIISNVYFAKMDSTNILARLAFSYNYLKSNIINTGLWLLFTLAVFFLIVDCQRCDFKKIQFFILFPVAWIIYLFYIGGDIYNERFLIVLYPFLIYLLLFYLKKYKNFVLYFSVLMIFVATFWFVPLDARFAYSRDRYDLWITLGKFIGKEYPGKVVAVSAAGKVPFYSGLTTIDMLGLTNKHIARLDKSKSDFIAGHSKFDPDYILGESPDLIIEWIFMNEDFLWGLTKDKYSQHYALKYLANASYQSLPVNIIDVSGFTDVEIREKIKAGFNAGVLVRKSPDFCQLVRFQHVL